MSDSSSETIAQLMEIAGISDHQIAENILKICDNNLERAINYHLENEQDEVIVQPEYGNSSSGVASEPSAAAAGNSKESSTYASEHASLPDLSNGGDEDNVRAPIPAKREQMLLPEEDNFRFGGVRKRRPLFTVCPLRNFAREAELQEQQLMGGNPDEISTAEDVSNQFPSRPSSRRIAHRASAKSNEKRKRLEDLFRPPIDLLFCGTFQAARSNASSKNRWLIVNLQDQKEFKSQILNRDIWPEKELKELILKYFILWQVSVENPEGRRFQTFYHCKDVPYVCIIDPRTGEEKLICDPVTPQTFRSDLLDFLNENSYTLDPDEGGSSTSNLPEPSTSSSSSTQSRKRRISATSTATNSNSNTPKKHPTSDLSEDDQMALAIRNSLKETQARNNNSNCGDDSSDDDTELVEFSDNSNSCTDAKKHFAKVKAIADVVTEDISYQKFLGNPEDPITKLQLRLPFQEQQRVQLDWPSSSKLRAIRLYVMENYSDLIKVPYKLITAFPRKDILELDENLTLKEANLHPTSILHLHLDD